MEVTTIESKAYREMTSKIDNIEKSALNFRPNNPVKSEKDRLTDKEICIIANSK